MKILQWLFGNKTKELDEEEELLEDDLLEEVEIKPVNLPDMTLLVFADLHNGLKESDREIVDNHRKIVDVIITLGDIPVEGLMGIDMTFGVLGNHDCFGQLGDTDIHGRIEEVKGVTFTGLQGSMRYKEGNHVMYTQEESIQLDIPKADILLTHDTEYQVVRNISHRGLMGITNYIKENKPALHLHGHLHTNTIKQIGSTVSIGIYKCALIKIINGEVLVEILF